MVDAVQLEEGDSKGEWCMASAAAAGTAGQKRRQPSLDMGLLCCWDGPLLGTGQAPCCLLLSLNTAHSVHVASSGNTGNGDS